MGSILVIIGISRENLRDLINGYKDTEIQRILMG